MGAVLLRHDKLWKLLQALCMDNIDVIQNVTSAEYPKLHGLMDGQTIVS